MTTTTSGTLPDSRTAMILGATGTGLALPITGLAVHVLRESASGRGLRVWSVGHRVCGALFTAFVLGHIVINRRAFYRHLEQATALPRRATDQPSGAPS